MREKPPPHLRWFLGINTFGGHPMKALVVYESVFGNTRSVAEAITEGLMGDMEVILSEVGAVKAADLDSVDLLIAGGPTHAFGMSRESSRKNSVMARDGKPARVAVSQGTGLREWLESLHQVTKGARAAAFDTRVARPWFLPTVGSAAKDIAAELRRRGYRVVADGRGFVVTGTEGPLAEGELDRARAYGKEMAGLVAAAVAIS